MTTFIYPKSLHKFHLVLLVIAFGVYLITAINSKGYFHYDEHYQIIEFANLKLGVNSPSDLAWEYKAQIRPAIQPTICVALFKLLHVTGITDAYTLALSLRLLSLLLSLTAISFFVRSSLPLVEPGNRKFFILLSYLLWFLPFLNVRFSSESWSGTLFLLAVALLQLNVSKRKSRFILAGLILGLSFLCRFQSVFLIMGLLCWLMVIQKERISHIGIIIAGACVALIAGIIVDRWFYETPVFTPWNYFNINILKGVASSFGTSPWYYYIGTILNASMFPIGSLILACFCILLYKKPGLLLLWVIFPFLIVHSIIPHKEDRFLIPLINFIPLMIALGWQEIYNKFALSSRQKVYQTTVYIVATFLTAINVLGLAIMASRPMGNGTKAITYYIHKNYKDKPANLIYDTNTNPYNPLYLLSLNESFYADNNIHLININELLKKSSDPLNTAGTNLFVFEKESVDYPDNKEVIKRLHLKPKIQSIPMWIEWICRYDNYFDNKSVIVLYGDR
jgi:phosphatidylinositol glycan class B